MKVAGLRIWTGKSRHKQNTGRHVRGSAPREGRGAGHGVPRRPREKDTLEGTWGCPLQPRAGPDVYLGDSGLLSDLRQMAQPPRR